MFYKLLQTIAENRMKNLQMTKCTECCDPPIDIKPRTSDTDIISERASRHNKFENDSRPKIDDKAGVSNMEIDHSKINECHTSHSQSHVKPNTCDKVICSKCLVTSKNLSSDDTKTDSVDLIKSSEEKTDKLKEMVSKCTNDKAVEDTEDVCHSEPVVNSDKTATLDIFRKLNLHPKHPDDNDHMVFDLFRIESVLQEVLHDEDYKIICTDEELELARQLLNRIQNFVNVFDKK